MLYLRFPEYKVDEFECFEERDAILPSGLYLARPAPKEDFERWLRSVDVARYAGHCASPLDLIRVGQFALEKLVVAPGVERPEVEVETLRKAVERQRREPEWELLYLPDVPPDRFPMPPNPNDYEDDEEFLAAQREYDREYEEEIQRVFAKQQYILTGGVSVCGDNGRRPGIYYLTYLAPLMLQVIEGGENGG